MHVFYQLNVFKTALFFEKVCEITQKLTDFEILVFDWKFESIIEFGKILNVFDHLENELKAEIKILKKREYLRAIFLNSLLNNDASSLNAVEWGFDVMDNRSQLQKVLFFLVPELLKLPLISKVFEKKDKMWLSLNRESLACDLKILGGIHNLVTDISLLASFCYLLKNGL